MKNKKAMTENNILTRAELLKAMDIIIRSLNNESSINNWLMLGPGDGAGEAEYRATAEFIEADEDETSCYEDACRCFVKTIINYGKDGFFAGEVESANFTIKEYKKMLLDRAEILSKLYDIDDKRRVYTNYEIKVLYEFLTGEDSEGINIHEMVQTVQKYREQIQNKEI